MPETIIAGQVISFPDGGVVPDLGEILDGPDSDLQWAIDKIRKRLPLVNTATDYIEGRHALAFATEKWKTTFGKTFAAFSDNLCPRVVNTKADRLQLAGIRVLRGGKPDKDLSVRVMRAYERARLDRRQGNVHKAALTHGDAYVIVWPDEEGRARLFINKADKVVVRWSEDDPGAVDLAAKVWRRRDKKVRVNLYYEDRIEKYVTVTTTQGGIPEKAKGRFERHTDEGEEWPLNHDLGRVPVVAFPNDADEGEDGVSELRDAIPIQDALNKTNADMLIAEEFAGFPQRWAIGLEEEIDEETQKPIPPMKTGIERMVVSDDPNTRFGQFDPADLTKFIAAADSWRGEMARVTGTPLHYLLMSGDFPSGEALELADAPLTAAVKDRQASFGSSWEEVAMLMLRVEDTSLAAQLDDEDVLVQAVWRSTSAKSGKQEAETQEIKQRIGVSERQSLREMGYTDDEIESMQEEADEEAGDVAAAAMARFDQGRATGFEPPGSGVASQASAGQVERVASQGAPTAADG